MALVLAGCSASSDGGAEGGSPQSGGTLKFALATDPTCLDPQQFGLNASLNISRQIVDSLTDQDPKTGEIKPWLAESWEVNDAATSFTFTLRDGVTFSDGTPVDGAAIKDAIERAQKQKNSALFGDLTSIKTVTADGLDVVLDLSQVDYQIPQLLGERVLQVASPKAAADPEKLDQSPVGAGPFKVTQLVPGTKAVLEKNPDYWDADNIHIDKVELVSAPDASTVVNGLKTGVYNFADLDPSQADAAEKAGLDVFVQPGFNASNISLNINKKPFDNPKVVDAVRYAVDRQEFVDKLAQEIVFRHVDHKAAENIAAR